MQPASKSEAAHANYANPNGYWLCLEEEELETHFGEVLLYSPKKVGYSIHIEFI